MAMKTISYWVLTLAALLIVACGGDGGVTSSGVTSSVDRESATASARAFGAQAAARQTAGAAIGESPRH
jgi:hypothetical protein